MSVLLYCSEKFLKNMVQIDPVRKDFKDRLNMSPRLFNNLKNASVSRHAHFDFLVCSEHCAKLHLTF